MLVTVSVTSPEGFIYAVELDDSSMADDPAEYRVIIKHIASEEPSAFGFSRLVNKDFMVNISYEPDIEWGVYLDETHDDMLAAIGKAYLTEIGY